MPSLHSLLLAAQLAALTLAIPTTLSPRAVPGQDGVPYTAQSVPANGVFCETANEAGHIFSHPSIIDVILKGYEQEMDRKGVGYMWPQDFTPALLVQPNHPTTWAEGCDPNAIMLAQPMAWFGGCEPYQFVRGDGVTDCETPTTDVVLFQMDASKSEATFCAVMTNSEFPGQQGGYRQCNNA